MHVGLGLRYRRLVELCERMPLRIDSTMPPPPNQRFSLTNVSTAARHKEGNYWETSFHIFSCVQRSDDRRRRRGGWRGTPYFWRYGLELVLKPAISFKKSWGGYHRRTTLRGNFLSEISNSSCEELRDWCIYLSRKKKKNVTPQQVIVNIIKYMLASNKLGMIMCVNRRNCVKATTKHPALNTQSAVRC